MHHDRLDRAIELMNAFARRTAAKGHRYLWTDAFAVETYIALAAATGDDRFESAARDLIGRVHAELGRSSADDPVAGGLRIGKPLPERGPDEPYDAELEWNRDGQYFHYLTKWMLALDRFAVRTRDETYHRWARKLAIVAHHAFTYGPPSARAMYWKMSIDLRRPLVRSMGLHDPLDGYVTCRELETSAREQGFSRSPDLAAASDDYGAMAREMSVDTADPLGIGELLVAARRLNHDPLARTVRQGALRGLRLFARTPLLRTPADRRLAFRELGLAIGLAAVAPDDVELAVFVPLRAEIERFWLDPVHQHTEVWREHENIDAVMLAASLCAGQPPKRARSQTTTNART